MALLLRDPMWHCRSGILPMCMHGNAATAFTVMQASRTSAI